MIISDNSYTTALKQISPQQINHKPIDSLLFRDGSVILDF